MICEGAIKIFVQFSKNEIIDKTSFKGILPAVLNVKIIDTEIYEGPTFDFEMTEEVFIEEIGLSIKNKEGGHKITMKGRDLSFCECVFSIGKDSIEMRFMTNQYLFTKIKLGDNLLRISVVDLGWNGCSIHFKIMVIKEIRNNNESNSDDRSILNNYLN